MAVKQGLSAIPRCECRLLTNHPLARRKALGYWPCWRPLIAVPTNRSVLRVVGSIAVVLALLAGTWFVDYSSVFSNGYQPLAPEAPATIGPESASVRCR
jgi:hypothetical protein